MAAGFDEPGRSSRQIPGTSVWLIGTLVTLLVGSVPGYQQHCPSTTVAYYELLFETFWSRRDFPKHYPQWRPPASWSKLIGFTHDMTMDVFHEGSRASPAVKEFCETGASHQFEFHTQGQGGIFDAFTTPPLATGVGVTKTRFFIDGNHSKVSVVAKLIPSPDWFVGIDSLDLCEDGYFITSLRKELQLYDAGTDNGFTFTSSRWPSLPQKPILPITAKEPNHPSSSFFYEEIDHLPTIAHAIITKVKEYVSTDYYDKVLLSDDFGAQDDRYKYEIDKEDSGIVRSNDVQSMMRKAENDLIDHVTYMTSTNEIPEHPIVPPPILNIDVGPPQPHNVYPKTTREGDLEILGEGEAKQLSLVVEPGQLENETEGSTATDSKKPKPSKVSTRKTIPTGNAMEVIDDIVKNYQKEQRRKHKQKMRKKNRIKLQKIRPPRDCKISEWSDWSTCSKSCGIGEKVRTRQILKTARRGGKPCPVLTETTWCGSARDCPKTYFQWKF